MRMLLDLLRGRGRRGEVAGALHASCPEPAVLEQLEGRVLLSAYEVWLLDQSDTRDDGGGTLYIYRGNKLAGRKAARTEPEVIDLGGAARDLALAETGTAPRRAHYLEFNPSHTHAIISFVATGHVLFMDAATREPVGVVDVGAQAHAAIPSPDGSFVLVANQNGKLLQKINTDYSTNTFTLDDAATLDLATCTTPSGAACEDPALRPDNAPIIPQTLSDGRLAVVTLRGGGMFVVDTATTPMAIVAEYDAETVHSNGLLVAETAGKFYVNSGGGTGANPLEADVYSFPVSGFSTEPNAPNTPAPNVVFSHDDRGFVDSHGMAVTKQGRHLWVADRAANRIIVVNTRTDRVVREIELTGALSDDPAPDLMEFAPSGNRLFVTLRGPNPLTGNAPGADNAVGSTPGLGVLRVGRGGEHGVFQAVIPISHVVDGVELADPHGLGVRLVDKRTEKRRGKGPKQDKAQRRERVDVVKKGPSKSKEGKGGSSGPSVNSGKGKGRSVLDEREDGLNGVLA